MTNTTNGCRRGMESINLENLDFANDVSRIPLSRYDRMLEQKDCLLTVFEYIALSRQIRKSPI